jgi:preprotein translocase subunit SecA
MGQKDPLVEYQREGFDMFLQMQDTIKEDFARYIFHVELVREDDRGRRPPSDIRQERRQIPMTQMNAPPADEPEQEAEEPVVQQARSEKIPRNSPCPCGSGKKYKHCHGRPGAQAL